MQRIIAGTTRRVFLGHLGRGMFLASLGPSLAFELGLASEVPADAGGERLHFGELEPLVQLMQDTQPAELLLNEIEQKVLQAIDSTPTTLDAVAADASLPIHRVLSTVSVLEMRRLVRRVSGTQVVRVTSAATNPR